MDDFVNEAVLTFMEDYEDGRDGREAYREFLESGERAIPLTEVVALYGLEDPVDGESREAAQQTGFADAKKDQQLSPREISEAA